MSQEEGPKSTNQDPTSSYKAFHNPLSLHINIRREYTFITFITITHDHPYITSFFTLYIHLIHNIVHKQLYLCLNIKLYMILLQFTL